MDEPMKNDPDVLERVQVCRDLTLEAEKQNVPTSLVLAIAWSESNFTNAGTNSSNCSGPLQIKYKYWCPNAKGLWSVQKADGHLENCNLYERGVFTVGWYRNKSKTLTQTVCSYWGDCKTRSLYVKRTVKNITKIKRILR